MQPRTRIEVSFGPGPPVVISVPPGTCQDLGQLQVVARLCLAARRAGGTPKVVGAPDRVRELLELAGLDAADLLEPAPVTIPSRQRAFPGTATPCSHGNVELR